jgi:hypothetical protein
LQNKKWEEKMKNLKNISFVVCFFLFFGACAAIYTDIGLRAWYSIGLYLNPDKPDAHENHLGYGNGMVPIEDDDLGPYNSRVLPLDKRDEIYFHKTYVDPGHNFSSRLYLIFHPEDAVIERTKNGKREVIIYSKEEPCDYRFFKSIFVQAGVNG